MNVDHLNLLVSIKDVVSYSILASLYDAAEEGSIIKRYLSDKEVLKSLRIFNKQPKSFNCIIKALDAKVDWLGRDLTLNILKKAWLQWKAFVTNAFHCAVTDISFTSNVHYSNWIGNSNR